MIAIQEGVIVASYRQRGKNKLWDYRIFDKQGRNCKIVGGMLWWILD